MDKNYSDEVNKMAEEMAAQPPANDGPLTFLTFRGDMGSGSEEQMEDSSELGEGE